MHSSIRISLGGEREEIKEEKMPKKGSLGGQSYKNMVEEYQAKR